MKHLISLFITALTVFMFACFGNDDSKPATKPDITGAKVLATTDDLPVCNADIDGQLFYIQSLDQFMVCDGSEYQVIDLTGPAGEDGEDGQDASDYPFVVYTYPAANEVEVERDAVIEIVFNKEMDGTTITGDNIILKDGSNTIGCNIRCTKNIVELMPEKKLDSGVKFTVIVKPDVKDAEGNNLYDFRFSFTVTDGNWRTVEWVETLDNGAPASDPQIASDSSGNAIAVWSQYDGIQYSIYANRYVNGAGWGTEELIETNNAGNAEIPKIAVDPSGNAIAVWQLFDGTNNNIYANRYVNGTGWGTAELIVTYIAEEEETGLPFPEESPFPTEFPFPQIAVDTSGNAFVVWQQFDGTRNNIYVNRYVNGTGWGASTLIETGNGDAEFPRIAADPSGNAIAVWTQVDGTSVRAYSNRYVNGTGWSTPVPVDSDEALSHDVHIAIDLSGNAIAVWAQWDGMRSNIWANRYVSAAGWGTAVLIETSDEGSADCSDVAVDSTGGAIVVWIQYNDEGVYPNNIGLANIWANKYVNGSGWGTAINIQSVKTEEASDPKVAINSTGDGFAVWSQDSEGGIHNIWANRYQKIHGWGTSEIIEADMGNAGKPDISVNSQVDAIAIWEQYDGTQFNILSNKFE